MKKNDVTYKPVKFRLVEPKDNLSSWSLYELKRAGLQVGQVYECGMLEVRNNVETDNVWFKHGSESCLLYKGFTCEIVG